MKNLKSCLFIGLSFLMTATTFAQSHFNILNAKTPDEIGKVPVERQIADQDTPLAYWHIDDRDVLWSKIVWEHIDLNQRINLPLYFPIDTTYVVSDRRSLFYTLLNGIKKGKIKEVYEDSFFKSRMSVKDIEQRMVRVDTSDYAFELLNSGETNIQDGIDVTRIQAQDIDGYQIKGIWYFDKRQGEMKYRMLAIAPMAPDVQILGREDMQSDESLPLFWVYYPSARQVLHESSVFNEKNPRASITFDDLLNARRFSALILREQNMYGNRAISDYIQGNATQQVLESERIKEHIRNKELDMWNY